MLSEKVVLSPEQEITFKDLAEYISNLGECDFTFKILDTYKHIIFKGDSIELYNDEEDKVKVTVKSGQHKRVIAYTDITCITLQILSCYSIASLYPVGRLLIFPR